LKFAWKFLLPLALLNILVAGLWRWMPHGAARWLICTALIAGPYVALARALTQGQKVGKRTYRYAD
jgi:NADH-quinone oxidoreductase subunit H